MTSNHFLPILAGVFFSGALILETVGVWARYVGAVANLAVSGYSLHVRVATVGRGFVLISAPLFGLMTDLGHGNRALILAGVVAFVSFSIIVFLDYSKQLTLGSKILRGLLGIAEDDLSFTLPKLSEIKWDARFFFFAEASFLFVASGVILMNILAASFPQYRATLVQMSPLITITGTLIHVFYVDKRLASAADADSKENMRDLTIQYIIARLLGAVTLVGCFSLALLATA